VSVAKLGDALSPVEIYTLKRLALGMTIKEIARADRVGQSGVTTLVYSLFRLLRMGHSGVIGDLSKLEVKTLRLLALGHSPEQIARRYNVRPAAIHSRVKRAAEKMNTPTLVATVMMAYQLGYFRLPMSWSNEWVPRSKNF